VNSVFTNALLVPSPAASAIRKFPKTISGNFPALGSLDWGKLMVWSAADPTLQAVQISLSNASLTTSRLPVISDATAACITGNLYTLAGLLRSWTLINSVNMNRRVPVL
jgi:hypothetical protein